MSLALYNLIHRYSPTQPGKGGRRSPSSRVMVLAAISAMGLFVAGCGLPLHTRDSTALEQPEVKSVPPVVDIHFRGQGFPVRIARHYPSESTFNGPLGRRWTHSYLTYAEERLNGVIMVFNPTGSRSYFVPAGNGLYFSSNGDGQSLLQTADGSMRVIKPSGTVHLFDANGTLISIEDEHGGMVGFEHDPQERLSAIIGDTGRIARFFYDGHSRITVIKDTSGRSATYKYDNGGNLIGVTNAGGLGTRYEYDAGGNLIAVIDSEGRRTSLAADNP
ncbi:MAG: RHS repeat protein [Gammaproteobacteria bacterium]|nr:RHS repeat protein [Gammaproteobacteria bacterium]